MEEQLQKRNTDCVYFLASPLTCKKGIDCEYRHSDIARLNTRDCWYWLAGNCLNPNCGFRHPPLEKHAEAPSESTSLPYQSSVPASKTSIPCYFYFSGFCNKGDKCSFLHGPDGNAPMEKSLKTSSEITDNSLQMDNKKSDGNDTVSAPIGALRNTSETAPKAVEDGNLHPKQKVRQPVPRNMIQQSPIPEMSDSKCEEAPVLKCDLLRQAEGFMQSRSYICTDQTSEEQMDDCVGSEERWESSPGFDVLVEDKSENLDYEDDREYLPALDREHGELNGHLLKYDFEEPVGYDPLYHDAEGDQIYGSLDCVDDLLVFDEDGEDLGHLRDRMLDSPLSRKRKLLPIELSINDSRGMDLREHLRKHRVIDGHPFTQLSRRQDSSCLLGRYKERPRRHGSQWLHGRLGKNAIVSHGNNGTLSNGANQHGWLRNSRSTRSRQRYKEKRLAKRHSLSSEVSRRQVPRDKSSNQAATAFTGPKTLAQIKEEKKKAIENGDCSGTMGHSSRTRLVDFEGPKPLSEILKEKGREGS